MGRISHRIFLKELPLHECCEFWGPAKRYVSSYEMFKVLSVTGGVPRYLEEIIPELTAEENIRKLCFQPTGLLFSEFEDIFADLFSSKAARYRKIVKLFINGSLSLKEISQKLKREKGGDLTKALEELVESGFVARDTSWNFKNVHPTKTAQFRLCDNYLRFYLKFIYPNKARIENKILDRIPDAWLSIMGLQFENLVVNNLPRIYQILSIPPNEILCAGPYNQTGTARKRKCQIDLLIQTRYNQLYICEIKFQSRELGCKIKQEVENKIESLAFPKGFSCRPILIHVNGVTDELISSDYFSAMIDFGQLLENG